MKEITQQFEIADVQKSTHWPAWQGNLEQVHITIKKRGAAKGNIHLYVPSTHELAKTVKGSHLAIFIHSPVLQT